MSHLRLAAEHLDYRYERDGALALSDCSMQIEPHSRVALLGANGSGKSTLLLHLNGSLRPMSGAVHLGEEPQGYDRKALRAWRREVGLVLQDPDDMLFAGTVLQEVGFGPLNIGLSETDARLRVATMLDDLGLAHLADRPTHLLSGGERHRVAIAAVAVMAPCVLLLDEPTAGLDPAGVSEVLDLLDKLHVAGTSIVLSTHDMDLAAAWATAVVVLHEGRVLASGTPDLLMDAELVATARLRRPSVAVIWDALPVNLRPVVCPRSVDELAAWLDAQRSEGIVS
jgi:cobalt/nickel transport system ATP-binding protein